MIYDITKIMGTIINAVLNACFLKLKINKIPMCDSNSKIIFVTSKNELFPVNKLFNSWNSALINGKDPFENTTPTNKVDRKRMIIQ